MFYIKDVPRGKRRSVHIDKRVSRLVRSLWLKNQSLGCFPVDAVSRFFDKNFGEDTGEETLTPIKNGSPRAPALT